MITLWPHEGIHGVTLIVFHVNFHKFVHRSDRHSQASRRPSPCDVNHSQADVVNDRSGPISAVRPREWPSPCYVEYY